MTPRYDGKDVMLKKEKIPKNSNMTTEVMIEKIRKASDISENTKNRMERRFRQRLLSLSDEGSLPEYSSQERGQFLKPVMLAVITS